MRVDAKQVTLAVEELTADIVQIIDKNVHLLRDELVRTTPVDTGDMKSAWTTVIKTEGWLWRFGNFMKYSGIIARGRRPINGRMYGSIQNGWSAGITPFFRKFDKRIEKEFNAKQY